MAKKLSYHQYMYNLYTKFIKILEICKQFSQNLVNEAGNIPRRGYGHENEVSKGLRG